ncbi:MAG: hypothetical protein ACOYU3_08715 [Bacillota bacterium]
MALIKCPRCELNYIKEGENFCNVCKRELRREADVEVQPDICTECNEAPVVPGEDLCILCLREKKRQENLEKVLDDAVDDDDESELIEEKLEDVDIDVVEEELPADFDGVDEDLDADAGEDFADEPFGLDEETFGTDDEPYETDDDEA